MYMLSKIHVKRLISAFMLAVLSSMFFLMATGTTSNAYNVEKIRQSLEETEIGESVTIDGFRWTVIEKATQYGMHFALLIIHDNVFGKSAFRSDGGPANQKDGGDTLQEAMDAAFAQMNDMKAIAAQPMLNMPGTGGSAINANDPNAVSWFNYHLMAGTQTKNMFFALSNHDMNRVTQMPGGVELKDLQGAKDTWWLRSHGNDDSTLGMYFNGVSFNLSTATDVMLGVAPAVWVKYRGAINGEDYAPAEATIFKRLKMPINTSTPQAEYIFKLEKDHMVNNKGTVANMPDLDDVTITFQKGEEPLNGTFIKDGVKTVVKESSNFLEGVKPEEWKNGEGRYIYKLWELDQISSLDPDKEGGHYSEAVYSIEIAVIFDNKGTLFPIYVTAKTISVRPDEYYEENGGSTNGKGDLLIFTNRYWKTPGGGIGNPGVSALDISNTITGIGSNYMKYFDFEIIVTQPSIINKPVDGQGKPTAREYKAYVVQGGSNNAVTVVTDKNNFDEGRLVTDTNGDKYIVFTSGNPLTVSLKHGQRLAFVDLHAGSSVEVEEKGAFNHRASYNRSFSKQGVFTSQLDNSDWGFPWGTDPDSEDPGPHYTMDGTNTNRADFTNEYTRVTPTGISVNDLPYIVLIGMAFAGLAGYVAIRYFRKERYG